MTHIRPSDPITSALCDLACTVGEADSLHTLLSSVLQALLGHTGSTMGLAVLPAAETPTDQPDGRGLRCMSPEVTIGDPHLAGMAGGTHPFPAALLPDTPALVTDRTVLDSLATSRPIAAAISIPVPAYGHLILLSPLVPAAMPALVDALSPVLIRLSAKIRRLRGQSAQQDTHLRVLSEVVEQSPVSIVITDLNGAIEYVNRTFTRNTGYRADEVLGENPRILQGGDTSDLEYATLWETITAGRSWTGVFHNRRKDGSLFWEEALIAPVRNAHGDITHFMGIKEDVTDRRDNEEQLRLTVDRLDRIIRQTIDAFTAATIHTDPYTAGHEVRVTDLCRRLGARLGLASFRRTGLEIAARCHDIGQIKVPAEILLRPRRLTPLEYDFVKLHATVGWEILRAIDFPWPVAEIVRQHHENFNGSGYPRGLAGEDILLEARILRVADLTESLASHRPFRQAFAPDEVDALLRQYRGTILDPHVTDACLAILEDGYAFPAPDLGQPVSATLHRALLEPDQERAVI